MEGFGVEKRMFHRFPCAMGSVSVRNLQRDFESSGRCVDLSAGGISFETEKVFFPGDPVEIWMDLKNNLSSFQQGGKVVWAKRMYPEKFRIGIEFQEPQLTKIHQLVEGICNS